MNKTVLVFLAISIGSALPTPTDAQSFVGFKPASITVSTGDDPISSGLSGIGRFTNADSSKYVEAAFQSEQFWGIAGVTPASERVSSLLGGTVGHFQGAPFVGPIASADVDLAKLFSIGITFWPAFFIWEPSDWKDDGVENTESVFLGNFMSARVGIGAFELS